MSNKVIYAIYNDDDILMDAKKPEQPTSYRRSFTHLGSRFDNNGACANQLFVHSYTVVRYFILDDEIHIMIQEPPLISRFSYIENMPHLCLLLR
jgi:hypothetical protein